jgi:eukaryotic-like serine/threonine-protein kinase
MTEEQARSVFLAALERPPEQWPTFLDQACGSNVELVKRVEQLLHAHAALGSIDVGGSSPALAQTFDETPGALEPGTRIGPYKLLEQIGEGGMGVVYMAAQTHPVERKVPFRRRATGLGADGPSPHCQSL